MKFEELKEMYEGKEVDENEYVKIELNEYVGYIENNGNSGVYHDKTWYTAYSVDGGEFDFYG